MRQKKLLLCSTRQLAHRKELQYWNQLEELGLDATAPVLEDPPRNAQETPLGARCRVKQALSFHGLRCSLSARWMRTSKPPSMHACMHARSSTTRALRGKRCNAPSFMFRIHGLSLSDQARKTKHTHQGCLTGDVGICGHAGIPFLQTGVRR